MKRRLGSGSWFADDFTVPDDVQGGFYGTLWNLGINERGEWRGFVIRDA